MSRTAINGNLNVLEATKKRIAYLFDNYDNIQLSFSGGKDSTVLFHLLNDEAEKRNRKFFVYFQDQEAEYQNTIDFVEWVMSQKNVIPLWY
ncbi:TPA: phosphoadenosine phosphosulfate reductase family protein, partial [Campylobacter jejuni]|nr:phosphoadenosine phosphosulfate reductase family protein [Campylobacter jejuni]